jgi:hypothetical protein
MNSIILTVAVIVTTLFVGIALYEGGRSGRQKMENVNGPPRMTSLLVPSGNDVLPKGAGKNARVLRPSLISLDPPVAAVPHSF